MSSTPDSQSNSWSANYQEIVEAIYTGLLNRLPEPEGLADKVGRLSEGRTNIAALISEVAGSPEFLSSLPALGGRTPLGIERFTNDVSQHGEIFEVLKLMINEVARDGWVVDVGARGLERSNSYDLMRHFGWRGILVEANPRLISEIYRDFAGLNFALVNCAVSDKEGGATFTIGVNDDVSSLHSQAAEGWGETRGQIQVEMRRLQNILVEHGVPEEFSLLSVDIEGEDIAVLNDLIDNSPFRPRWVIIEASFDFAICSLQDGPFSQGVRSRYAIRWQNATNLILSRR